MTALNTSATDSWYRAGSPKTGQTDDARIKEITVLPPPEHLIRFFPIRGTAVETLISDTSQCYPLQSTSFASSPFAALPWRR